LACPKNLPCHIDNINSLCVWPPGGQDRNQVQGTSRGTLKKPDSQEEQNTENSCDEKRVQKNHPSTQKGGKKVTSILRKRKQENGLHTGNGSPLPRNLAFQWENTLPNFTKSHAQGGGKSKWSMMKGLGRGG